MAQNSDYDPTEDLLKVARNLFAVHQEYLATLPDDPNERFPGHPHDRLHLKIEHALDILDTAIDCSLYRYGHMGDV